MTKNRADRHNHFWSITLLCLSGPLAWAIHLSAIYFGHHAYCALPAGAYWFTGYSVVITLGLVLLLVFFALNARRLLSQRLAKVAHTTSFLVSVMQMLIILSILAILWTAMAFVFVEICHP